jgi:hypothetical protein
MRDPSLAWRGGGRTLSALIVLALVGCGSVFEPYDAIPRPLPRGASEAGDRVGVCYNAAFTTAERVREIAVESCGPGATPTLLGQDMRLGCPVLTPVRATFFCTPN